jgi:hypothetical protein
MTDRGGNVEAFITPKGELVIVPQERDFYAVRMWLQEKGVENAEKYIGDDLVVDRAWISYA